MIKAVDLVYKPGSRSVKMRKFKKFNDAEFRVIGCALDKGVSKEQFTWVVTTKEGKKFNAKPMGTKEEKLKWYANREKYQGKWLKIKFQGYSEDGIPRFPIAIHFRAGKGKD